MQTVTISKKIYKVGFSFRAIREFEKLTQKSITECKSTWDNLIFFYATLKALNPESFTMDLEQFTDAMDANPELLADFQTETTPGVDSTGAADSDPLTSRQKKSLPASTLWTLSLLLLASPVLVPVISGIIWIWMSLKLLARLIAKIGKKLVSLLSR
jgi:hypothetical protein